MCDILYHVVQPRPRCLHAASRLAGIVLVFLVAGCTSSGPEAPTPASAVELESAIGASPATFSFTYRARGTEVLDCVLPNREFTGTVFGSGDFTILDPDRTAPLLTRIEDTTYLSGDLFADGSIEGDWLSLGPEDLVRFDETIRRSLGTDLSSYVLSLTPPATGGDIALDAIDDARSIVPIDPIRIDADLALGHRLLIDGADDEPGVVLDVWIGSQGQVARVQVQRARADEPDLPNPDSGWLIDYGPLPTNQDSPDPPERAVDAAAVDPDSLGPPVKQGCDLEIGPEPSTPPPQP